MADTDSPVIKALAFPLLCLEYNDKALRGIIDVIRKVKQQIPEEIQKLAAYVCCNQESVRTHVQTIVFL